MPHVPDQEQSRSVPTRAVDGDMVLIITERPLYALVSSKSEVGMWHRVREVSAAGPDHTSSASSSLTCTCLGYANRGKCRHIDHAQVIASWFTTPEEHQFTPEQALQFKETMQRNRFQR